MLPNEILYFGLDLQLTEIVFNDKSRDQELIFGLFLPMVLLILNWNEIRMNAASKLYVLWIKSYATLLLCFVTTCLMSHFFFGYNTFNGYYGLSGAPAISICFCGSFSKFCRNDFSQ